MNDRVGLTSSVCLSQDAMAGSVQLPKAVREKRRCRNDAAGGVYTQHAKHVCITRGSTVVLLHTQRKCLRPSPMGPRSGSRHWPKVQKHQTNLHG